MQQVANAVQHSATAIVAITCMIQPEVRLGYYHVIMIAFYHACILTKPSSKDVTRKILHHDGLKLATEFLSTI